MNGAPRLNALTGLRGVAAWLVVLYHVRLSLVDLLAAPVIAVLAKGYLAVDLFFMLSGFVLWLNYAPVLAAGGQEAVRRFWWRRLARIWPLHLVILAGFVGLALAFAATGRDIRPYPWAELPLHLLLVQNWGFTGALAWNHPAWSISTEFAAYLVFPALVALGYARPASGPRLMAGAAGLLALLYLVFAVSGHERLGDAVATLGLPRCLIEFTLGTLAARLWLAWSRAPRRGWIALTLLATSAAAGALGIAAGWPETAFVPLCFLCALLALALDRGRLSRLLGEGPLLYLGEISYSTYLVHFGLFIVFKLALVGPSLQLDWPRLALFLALLLATSAGLYHGVEKPAQRWLGARYPWRSVRVAAA